MAAGPASQVLAALFAPDISLVPMGYRSVRAELDQAPATPGLREARETKKIFHVPEKDLGIC